jgi:hypothetical protein
MPLGLRVLIQQVLESRLLGQLHLCLFCYLITQTDEMLNKDSLREKLLKKQLIPAIQQMLVFSLQKIAPPQALGYNE